MSSYDRVLPRGGTTTQERQPTLRGGVLGLGTEGKGKGKKFAKRKAKWKPGSEPRRQKLLPSFPMLSISVLWLADFVKRHRTELEGKTTTEVSDVLLKPKTKTT